VVYRGEVGRIMVWRRRLDLTTTWAITSTTTIITVAFSFRDIPHVIFFFNLLIVWMMLWIEAQRYRFDDAFRVRTFRTNDWPFKQPLVGCSKFEQRSVGGVKTDQDASKRSEDVVIKPSCALSGTLVKFTMRKNHAAVPTKVILSIFRARK